MEYRVKWIHTKTCNTKFLHYRNPLCSYSRVKLTDFNDYCVNIRSAIHVFAFIALIHKQSTHKHCPTIEIRSFYYFYEPQKSLNCRVMGVVFLLHFGCV